MPGLSHAGIDGVGFGEIEQGFHLARRSVDDQGSETEGEGAQKGRLFEAVVVGGAAIGFADATGAVGADVDGGFLDVGLGIGGLGFGGLGEIGCRSLGCGLRVRGRIERPGRAGELQQCQCPAG